MSMIPVVLCELEVETAIRKATKIHEIDVAAGLIDKKVSEKDSLENRIQATGAEFAVAKLYNVYVDLTTNIRRGGKDLFINGYRVDVKHSDKLYANLIVHLDDRDYQDVDIFFLAVGLMPEYYAVGYIERDKIINPEHLVDWGHGLMYATERSELCLL